MKQLDEWSAEDGEATLHVVRAQRTGANSQLPVGVKRRAWVLEADEKEALIKCSVPLPVGTQVRLVKPGKPSVELVGRVAAIASIPERVWIELEPPSDAAGEVFVRWTPEGGRELGDSESLPNCQAGGGGSSQVPTDAVPESPPSFRPAVRGRLRRLGRLWKA